MLVVATVTVSSNDIVIILIIMIIAPTILFYYKFLCRPQPASLQEVTSDRLVPHTPVYGDPTIVTPMGFPSVPTSEQPRLVGSQPSSSAQGQ